MSELPCGNYLSFVDHCWYELLLVFFELKQRDSIQLKEKDIAIFFKKDF